MHALLRRAGLPLLLALAAFPALAQSTIGMDAAMTPAYPGARKVRVLPMPLVNLEYKPFFISTVDRLPGLGIKTSLAPDVTAGALLGASLGRSESLDGRLEGLGSISPYAQAGIFAEWNPGRFHASLSYMQAMKQGYGATASLHGSYLVFMEGKSAVAIGGDLAWGNRDHMQTWFGVTPAQAARSRAGLPAYRPTAGPQSLSAFAAWTYRLTGRWSANATVGVSSLLGDAADSPVSERRTGAFGMTGLTYSF